MLVTSVIFTSVPSVNGLPLSVSFIVISAIAVPPVNEFTGPPLSLSALSIASVTSTVTSAVSQLFGLAFSQIVYVSV